MSYWDIALPEPQRASFSFPHLLQAPLLLLPLANRQAYLERYSEQDKGHTSLGQSLDSWPAPYWTIDASFATMTLLLAFEDNGLNALFFAHVHEEKLREKFGIPAEVQMLGVIAVGYENSQDVRLGRSSRRQRHTPNQIIHSGHW